MPHFQVTVPYAVAMSTQDGMEGRPVAVQEGRWNDRIGQSKDTLNYPSMTYNGPWKGTKEPL